MGELKAIGITCGIGSMLVGARQAGFKVIGNVEWRNYYHSTDEFGRNTFKENFRGSLLHHLTKGNTERETIDNLPLDVIEKLMGADLALGHPECGNFSNLCGVNASHKQLREQPTDIPLFVDLVSKLSPKFFVMDDLPRSLEPFPMKEYVKRLPDYDLFPELVSNWGYGNVQKHRNRMFMIGSRKEQRWVFRPGEEIRSGRTLESVIGDLPEPRQGSNWPNHDPTAMNEKATKMLGMLASPPTWREMQEWMRTSGIKPGESFPYTSTRGEPKKKPGCKIEYWDSERGVSVQDGGSYKIHPIRLDNLTIRERARIQGFPDDFVFYGTRLNERGEYQPTKNSIVVKQTGKAMPIQFCHYVSNQIAAHLNKAGFSSSGERILKQDTHVDQAKQWYCENIGYADQEKACSSCWLSKICTIRGRKYNIGLGPIPEPTRGKEVERPAFTGPSPLRGRRVGIVRRTMDLLGKGQTTENILKTLYAEFPQTRASTTDVAKARSRMSKDEKVEKQK